jgi:hypothetical protein
MDNNKFDCVCEDFRYGKQYVKYLNVNKQYDELNNLNNHCIKERSNVYKGMAGILLPLIGSGVGLDVGHRFDTKAKCDDYKIPGMLMGIGIGLIPWFLMESTTKREQIAMVNYKIFKQEYINYLDTKNREHDTLHVQNIKKYLYPQQEKKFNGITEL